MSKMLGKVTAKINDNDMAEIQIKLTEEQHEFLLARLGSDEAIQEYLQAYLDQKVEELTN